MKLMDRYVIQMFLKIFAICLICLTGLFIVVDVFSNLEEFVGLGQRSEGIFWILSTYYLPRALMIFDRTSALLALAAAIGTLVWMQRFNELAAVEAGGISKSRIVRPILWCMLVLVGLSIINREFLIPRFRESLARTAQSWDGTESQVVTPQQDQDTDVWILSGKVTPAEKKIEQPEFRLPPACAGIGSNVRAESARSMEADEFHPAGFLLSQVKLPTEIDHKASVYVDGKPLVLTASDQPWIGPQEIFIASRVSLTDIAFGPGLRRFSSLAQQVAVLRNSSVWTSNRQRVEVHGRIVRPGLDFAILLIGIPLILSRRDRNFFMAMGTCLLVVMGIQVLILISQGLGASRIIPSAALAAWLPLIVLLPVGSAMHARLDL